MILHYLTFLPKLDGNELGTRVEDVVSQKGGSGRTIGGGEVEGWEKNEGWYNGCGNCK